jgi:hypothetical protein
LDVLKHRISHIFVRVFEKNEPLTFVLSSICRSYSAAIANATGSIIDVLAALKKRIDEFFFTLNILIDPHRYQECSDH